MLAESQVAMTGLPGIEINSGISTLNSSGVTISGGRKKSLMSKSVLTFRYDMVI